MTAFLKTLASTLGHYAHWVGDTAFLALGGTTISEERSQRREDWLLSSSEAFAPSPETNPATGLPMCGVFDVAGNAYGTSDD